MSTPDVILILGLGVQPTGNVLPHVQHEIRYALELSATQRIPAILFSGNYWGLAANSHSQPTEAEAMQHYAKTLQPKNLELLTETQSVDTIGNLMLSKIIIDNHHWKHILILSHPEHLVRVQYIAQKIFSASYTLEYHGHQALTTVQQFRHSRRYRIFATLYARWFLRGTWPRSNQNMLNHLYRHHFLYNGSWLKPTLQKLLSFR